MVTLKRHRKATIAFVVPVADCIHGEVFRPQENPSSSLSLQIGSQKISNKGIQKFGLMLLIHAEHKQACRYTTANSYLTNETAGCVAQTQDPG